MPSIWGNCSEFSLGNALGCLHLLLHRAVEYRRFEPDSIGILIPVDAQGMPESAVSYNAVSVNQGPSDTVAQASPCEVTRLSIELVIIGIADMSCSVMRT